MASSLPLLPHTLEVSLQLGMRCPAGCTELGQCFQLYHNRFVHRSQLLLLQENTRNYQVPRTLQIQHSTAQHVQSPVSVVQRAAAGTALVTLQSLRRQTQHGLICSACAVL